MLENQLKAQLLKKLRSIGPKYFVIPHTDAIQSGIPDISVSGFRLTSWLELKHATPTFPTKGIQEFTMLRLAMTAFARYVIYYDFDKVKSTMIIHPDRILGKKGDLTKVEVEVSYAGFDHDAVVRYLQRIHVG